MSDAANRLREIAIDRALRGPAKSSAEARRAAFDNAGVDSSTASGASEPVRALIDKVARHAWKVTPSDVAAAKAAGLSEDEIFELVVCAAYGQATRQLQSALAAVDAATGEKP